MSKLSIIYDVTALCPWDCPICCMGASSNPQCRSDELTREQKLAIVPMLIELRSAGYDVRIDLSGGEIFTNKPDHTELLREISLALGKEKVGVSCSGVGIDTDLAAFLGEYVGDVEMTMDVVPYREYALRPVGYSVAAAKAVHLLKEAGVKVGIQTVASSYNCGYVDVLSVFSWACANNVDNWSILRFFASGRGAAFPEAALDDAQCEQYVHMVQEIAANPRIGHKPAVDFHYLMPGHKKHTDVCRCVRHSIGILPNGNVVACFWALDSNTGTVEDKYLLGNVRQNTLLEILNGEKAHYWSDCEHCCELGSGDAPKGGMHRDILSA